MVGHPQTYLQNNPKVWCSDAISASGLAEILSAYRGVTKAAGSDNGESFGWP